MGATNGEWRKWLRRVGLILGAIIGCFLAFSLGWVAFWYSLSWGADEPLLFWFGAVVASIIFIGSIVAAWKFW